MDDGPKVLDGRQVLYELRGQCTVTSCVFEVSSDDVTTHLTGLDRAHLQRKLCLTLCT